MGEIDEGLERAERTRPIPQSTVARMRFLLKGAKGSTKQLAADLGVSQRIVQRWLKGQGTPKPAAAKAIETKVRAAWQPRVRARVRRDAEKNGFTLHMQASFGYSAAAGSTDDPRRRPIMQKMPGEVAQCLYAARDAGASQAEQEKILAEALGEHYFRQGGRARGLDVELNDIAWMDLEL
ncbi:transcriptional regulator with XRE-family HTH domain [Kitasatospora sp. MAA19]|uniref:telomere-protecting terminal protein Tpg n=1 Tax=Kitasatospora sp. MAA19 TaxID=3035090 RepID=UPI002476AF5C|nr:helix-turn-helix transcriptional regulator [Kitasatospora sp. MAA19]MDH6710124.1 transcriptional regulator with XRE-family HTH domain [Kitasatospora sp. MAA19]